MPDETDRSGAAWLEAAGRRPMYVPACNLYAMFRMVRPGSGDWWLLGRWHLPREFFRFRMGRVGEGLWFATAESSARAVAAEFDTLPAAVRDQLWAQAPLARAHAEAADLAAAL